MLFVFYGSDTASSRANMHLFIDELRAKKPDASVLHFDVDTFGHDRMPELLYGQGLFSKKYLVVLDHILDDAAHEAVIIHNIADIASSENIFVLLAGDLTEQTTQIVTRHAYKSKRWDKQNRISKSPRTAANVFLVTDALGIRNRQLAWLRFHEVINAGSVPEEVYGALFWQVKSMLLALETTSAKEAGMKAFAYAKAKQYAQCYTLEELRAMIRELVALYHDARAGEGELEVLLERWILLR